ncbi:MAG: hypothetical protein ACYTG4_04505 [Planctomycetota bacterium]
MEAGVFTKPEVIRLMQKFVLAKIYTDGKERERGGKLLKERFGREFIPYYVVVTADDVTVGDIDFPGGSTDAWTEPFRKFLDEMLEKTGTK